MGICTLYADKPEGSRKKNREKMISGPSKTFHKMLNNRYGKRIFALDVEVSKADKSLGSDPVD
ncbi:hypothetical protein WBG83_08075 [Paenibacillus sp. y28]